MLHRALRCGLLANRLQNRMLMSLAKIAHNGARCDEQDCPHCRGARSAPSITRARLIQSAEKVFARDGFEAAKLEEIAADAGYTRGAVYANFDSKEDLFLALLETGNLDHESPALEREMDKVREPEAKLKAMRDFFLLKRWTGAGACCRWSSSCLRCGIPRSSEGWRPCIAASSSRAWDFWKKS